MTKLISFSLHFREVSSLTCVCVYVSTNILLAFPAHFSRHKLMDHHSLFFSKYIFILFSSSFSLFNWLLLKYVYIIFFIKNNVCVCVCFSTRKFLSFPFFFVFSLRNDFMSLNFVFNDVPSSKRVDFIMPQ